MATIEAGRQTTRTTAGYALFAFLLGFITWISSMNGMSMSRPANPYIPEHLITWGIGLFSATFCLALSQACKSFVGRVFIGAGLLLTVTGFGHTCYWSYQNYHDLPAEAWIMAILLVAAAWPAKQRIIGLGALAAIVLGAAPRFPHSEGPTSRTIGDLTVEVETGRSASPGIRLVTPSPGKLAQKFDLGGVRVEASAGVLWPIETYLSRPSSEWPNDSPSEETQWLRMYRPRWLQHWSGIITVSEWPSYPGAEFDVLLSNAAKRETAGDFALWSVRIEKEEPGSASVSQAEIEFKALGSAMEGASFRVTDSQGRSLEAQIGTSSGGSDRTYTLYVSNPPLGGRIHISAFTRDQMEEGDRVFKFEDLPLSPQ